MDTVNCVIVRLIMAAFKCKGVGVVGGSWGLRRSVFASSKMPPIEKGTSGHVKHLWRLFKQPLTAD